MKRRFLSVSMAVVMAVVCLTGCSGNFAKNSFISAAKKNGMNELSEPKDLTLRRAGAGESYSFFYDVKESHIIESISAFSDYVSPNDVKDFVIAVESMGETGDHGSCITQAYFLTVKDSDTAEEIYESLIKPLVKPEEGEKDGVTYAVSYQGSRNDDSGVELAYGVYLKDNQIVLIRSDYDSSLKNNCVEGFCKSLGLVSPYTLR